MRRYTEAKCDAARASQLRELEELRQQLRQARADAAQGGRRRRSGGGDDVGSPGAGSDLAPAPTDVLELDAASASGSGDTYGRLLKAERCKVKPVSKAPCFSA